jgi:GTP cyclohydrolase I
MFWYTIKVTIISLLIIILSHHLLEILKKSLTNEKIIDCVKKPQKEYEKIYEILNENNNDILKSSFEEDDEAILTRHLLEETI